MIDLAPFARVGKTRDFRVFGIVMAVFLCHIASGGAGVDCPRSPAVCSDRILKANDSGKKDMTKMSATKSSASSKKAPEPALKPNDLEAQFMPVTPQRSFNISGIPPTFVATTGRLQAIDSIKKRLDASIKLGITTISEAEMY